MKHEKELRKTKKKKKEKKKNVKNYLLLAGITNKANKDNINIKIG